MNPSKASCNIEIVSQVIPQTLTPIIGHIGQVTKAQLPSITWFCCHGKAKQGNKTAALSWPDPYDIWNRAVIQTWWDWQHRHITDMNCYMPWVIKSKLDVVLRIHNPTVPVDGMQSQYQSITGDKQHQDWNMYTKWVIKLSQDVMQWLHHNPTVPEQILTHNQCETTDQPLI